MSDNASLTRRPSGRDARRAQRAGPLPDHRRRVRPGMPSGHYQPLTPSGIQQVHQTALRLLAEVGVADATDSGIEVTLQAQDTKYDLEPSANRAYFGTAGAAVNTVDAHGVYRESTIQDLYDIGRIVDVMAHIHFIQRAVVPRDIPDPYEMDFNTCYAAVSSSTKHVGSSWVQSEHVTASLEMLHAIAGSAKKWRDRPFVSQSNCFVVPPMKFAADACRCLEVAARGGMPILLLSAGQAGLAAGEMIDQVSSHVRPAKTRTVNERFIEFARSSGAVVDHRQDFPPERFPQPVGQVSRNFTTHQQRMHADVLELLTGALQRGLAR